MGHYIFNKKVYISDNGSIFFADGEYDNGDSGAAKTIDLNKFNLGG